jgi:hypothetical protein
LEIFFLFWFESLSPLLLCLNLCLYFVLCELTFFGKPGNRVKTSWVSEEQTNEEKCYVVWFCECLKSRIILVNKTSVYNLRHRSLAIIVMDLGKCPKKCFKDCNPCMERVTKMLPCTHEQMVLCHQDPANEFCQTPVWKVFQI